MSELSDTSGTWARARKKGQERQNECDICLKNRDPQNVFMTPREQSQTLSSTTMIGICRSCALEGLMAGELQLQISNFPELIETLRP